ALGARAREDELAPEPAVGPAAGTVGESGKPLRRQPAEGRVRPLAVPQPARADPRRADARRRRRRARGDPPPDQQSRGRGHRRAADLVGDRGGARARPSRARDAPRLDHPRVQRRPADGGRDGGRLRPWRENDRMTAQPSDPLAGDPVAATDPVSAEETVVPRVRSLGRINAGHVRDYGIVVFAIALFIYFTVASSVFLTYQNLLNIVFQNATIGIAACAVTFTIIAGNFDLSLGSIFVLSEVLAAYAAVHIGVWWAFPVAIFSGMAMGLINGLLVTKLRVNAFLATLATALSFGGIAVGVTSGGLLITPSSSVFTFIGQHRAGGIQYPVIIFVIVAIVLQLMLAYTVFGRHLYGVGDNRNAARLSGLKVDRTVIITFVITGAACGL